MLVDIYTFILNYISYLPYISEKYLAIVAMTLTIFLILFFAFGLCFLAKKLLIPAIIRTTRQYKSSVIRTLLSSKVLNAAAHLIPAIILWKTLSQTEFLSENLRLVFLMLTRLYILYACCNVIFVAINFFANTDFSIKSTNQQYIRTFGSVLKIIILLLALIIAVAIVINKDPSYLLAGLGTMSAILMLVFKDTIEGLVAGIRLTSNQMIIKGDWITVPGTPADGVVQDISLTTVKIQNFDNTIVTVSPKKLIEGSFQNWKGMYDADGRKVIRTLHMDFHSIKIADEQFVAALRDKGLCPEMQDTPTGIETNIGLFRRYVESLLPSMEGVNSEMPFLVRQGDAEALGAPMQFIFHLYERGGKVFEHQISTIMEQIYALSAAFDLKIYQKFPEQ